MEAKNELPNCILPTQLNRCQQECQQKWTESAPPIRATHIPSRGAISIYRALATAIVTKLGECLLTNCGSHLEISRALKVFSSTSKEFTLRDHLFKLQECTNSSWEIPSDINRFHRKTFRLRTNTGREAIFDFALTREILNFTKIFTTFTYITRESNLHLQRHLFWFTARALQHRLESSF